MESFNHTLNRIFQKILTDNVISEEELEKQAPRIAHDVMNQIAARIRRDLIRRASARLRETRRETRGFEKRNLQRWRKAFNLIEMLWDVAAETGGKFNE